jgi:hypothetical protein
VIEPVYDNGVISYILTPAKTPDPVHSNPIAAAPIYLPVYPAGQTTYTGPFLCNHQNMVNSVQVDNCPDHGDAISFLATWYDPAVYGNDPTTVLGHDHVLDGPASHGDFNIAWVPVLVLFKSLSDVQHFTSNSDIEAAAAGPNPTVTLIALDGSEDPFPAAPGGPTVSPDLTFHCSVVPQGDLEQGHPVAGDGRRVVASTTVPLRGLAVARGPSGNSPFSRTGSGSRLWRYSAWLAGCDRSKRYRIDTGKGRGARCTCSCPTSTGE